MHLEEMKPIEACLKHPKDTAERVDKKMVGEEGLEPPTYCV